jgi:hypothetical protein
METATKKTLDEADLAQFTGSEQWFKHWLGPVYTEGVKHVADTAGAYWLIDSIVINQTRPKIKREEFQLWILTTDLEKHSATLRCEDGNGHVVYKERIPYTDFVLAELRLYFTDGTLLLPSEY